MKMSKCNQSFRQRGDITQGWRNKKNDKAYNFFKLMKDMKPIDLKSNENQKYNKYKENQNQ